MGRAPALVGLLLAVSIAVLIALAGPLLLFNPWFVSLEQARSDVPARLETSQPNVDRVTGAVLGDIWGGGDFEVSLDGRQPLLDRNERSHMRDVASLVRLLGTLAIVSAVVVAFTLLTLRRERRRVGRLLLVSAGIVGTVAVVVAAIFAVAFDQAFLAFHRVFFPQGNFLFGPDSNLLRLFPEPFWFDAALIAGVSIVVAALLVTVVGWWLWRARSDS
jgi:integral membrane protein (TIGR01906 family)